MSRATGPKPVRICLESWAFALAHIRSLAVLVSPFAACALGLFWMQVLTAPAVTLTDVAYDSAWPAALRGHAALFALVLLAPALMIGTGIMQAVFANAVTPRPHLEFGRAERAVFLSQAKLLGAGAAFTAATALPGFLIAMLFFGLIRAEGLDLDTVNREGGPMFGLFEVGALGLFVLCLAFFLVRGLVRQLAIAPHAAFTGRASLKETWVMTAGYGWELLAVLLLMAVSYYGIVFAGLAPVYALAPDDMRALFDVLIGRVPAVTPAGGWFWSFLAAAHYAVLVTFSSLIVWIMFARTYQSVALSARIDRALKGPADEPGEAVAAALEGTGFGKRTEPPVAPTPQP